MFQLDVKNAFLNGELKKKACMPFPPRYEEYRKCYKLKKVYMDWRNPSGHCSRGPEMRWKKQGCSQRNGDYMLFVKINDKKVIVLLVYINDMIVTGDDNKEMSRRRCLLLNLN